jgi:hypothetical protein
LAGFEAQKAQIPVKDGFEAAKVVMNQEIQSDVHQDIGGDEQRINNLSTSYSAITFKQVLLPVWLTVYRYQNKQYQVIINARTGEVQGDRPYSIIKITLAILTGIVIVIILIMIFSGK